MNKKSFVFHSSWGDLVEGLPDETAGELLHMIISYVFKGMEVKSEDPTLNAVFGMIRNKLDEDAGAYEERCKARKEAGSKGGKQKVANAKQSVAKLASAKHCLANVADTDTVTDTDTDTDTDTNTDTESPKETKKKSKKEKASLTVEQMQDIVLQSDLSSQVQDKIIEWIEYKQARREPYVEIGFKSLVTQVTKREREVGADAVCDLVDLCMSSQWKGIIWDKLQAARSTDWSKI